MLWNGNILRIRNKIKSFFSFLLLFLFLCLIPRPLLAFDLEGRVKLAGPAPEQNWIQVSETHKASCGEKKLSPKLLVNEEGFLANVIVELEGDFPSDKNPVSKGSFKLDQSQCEFSPHVLLLPAGSTLQILNSDDMLHNVRAFDESKNMLFNDAMPRKGQILKKQFAKPGRMIFRCGIHRWMYAVVVVEQHPFYAVTDPSGYFKITEIPEGTYKLTLWHELLGEMSAEVTSKTNFITLTYPSKGVEKDDKASSR